MLAGNGFCRFILEEGGTIEFFFAHAEYEKFVSRVIRSPDSTHSRKYVLYRGSAFEFCCVSVDRHFAQSFSFPQICIKFSSEIYERALCSGNK